MSSYDFMDKPLDDAVADPEMPLLEAAGLEDPVPLSDVEQVRADIEARRATSDALQVKLDERRQAAAPPVADDPEGVATATGTITYYKAWMYPRGNVVIEEPSGRVEASFPSLSECEIHASQLNEWLARRPSPDQRYRVYTLPPEPTEARLVEIFDRGRSPENTLRFDEELRAAISDGYEKAAAADAAMEGRRQAVESHAREAPHRTWDALDACKLAEGSPCVACTAELEQREEKIAQMLQPDAGEQTEEIPVGGFFSQPDA